MRKADIKRETSETNIRLKLNIDGSGKGNIKSENQHFNILGQLLNSE